MAHPHFARGLWRLSERFMALHQGQIINKLIATTQRYYVTAFALILHASRDPADVTSGITLSRIQERCAALRLLSPGQVRALFELMQQTGRLVPVEGVPDKRLRLQRPGALLVAEGRARNAMQLEALEDIFPDRGHLLRLQTEPEFLWAMERARGMLFEAVPVPEDRFPEFATTWRIDGGYMVMMALLAACRVDDALPRPGKVRMGFSETAERFGISRSQVRRCIAAFEASGVVQIIKPGGDALVVRPRFIEQVTRWKAMRLLRFAACAEMAEAQLG